MKARKRGVFLIVLGMLAISSAAGLWLYNMFQELAVIEYSEQKTQVLLAHISNKPGIDTTTEIPDDTSDLADLEEMKYIVLDDGEAYIGLLGIPALDLLLPVNRTLTYEALKYTPCLYSGDIKNDTIVIGAHNYASHFQNISHLAAGEVVTLTDTDGNEIIYRVTKTETVQPTDVDSVVNSEYDLTLFTCTYNGQARVVVKCMRFDRDQLLLSDEGR